MESKSIIGNKSYQFSLEIVREYKKLTTVKREFILSKQLLRSATSIGANVNEALAGESKRDFVHKLHIALKESRETEYWLNLLKDSEFIEVESFETLSKSCREIIRLLNSIILTTKEKYLSKVPI